MQLSRGRKALLRNLRAAKCQACTITLGNKREPAEEQVPRTSSADVSKRTSFTSSWVTHRAPDNLLLGCRPGIRKDKPEGYGAALRPKGGCRARCARRSGSPLSSPVRAEQVVSYTKRVQGLVCTLLSSPSVPVQTGSVWRKQARKDAPLGRRRRTQARSSWASSALKPRGVSSFSSKRRSRTKKCGRRLKSVGTTAARVGQKRVTFSPAPYLSRSMCT